MLIIYFMLEICDCTDTKLDKEAELILKEN